METRPPTVVQLLVAVAFTLSCFALLLFLWISFGGPTPLKPEGYRLEVPFDEATALAVESDVRISGVSVGKVKTIDLSDEGKAVATLEIDSQYAPLPDNTKAILRQKTLLGETYVELTPGGPGEPDSSDAAAAQTATTDTSTDSGGFIPEGGALPELQVSDAVQLDEIFRAFDEPTRLAFQRWMQEASVAFRGRGADLNAAIGNLAPFATEGNQLLTILDSQRLATREFVRNTGEVFEALSERKGQLQGLIRNTNTVFSTTAQRNEDLQEAFVILPTFLDESRLTLTRLEQFANDTDPLVQQLRPAAQELSPTLVDLGRLAPELTHFFNGLLPASNHAKSGLGALQDVLSNQLPDVLTELDPLDAAGDPDPPGGVRLPPRDHRPAGQRRRGDERLQPRRRGRQQHRALPAHDGAARPRGPRRVSEPPQGEPHQPLRRAARLPQPGELARELRDAPMLVRRTDRAARRQQPQRPRLQRSLQR